MKKFSFTLEKTIGHSRAATFVTPHGTVNTPVFMPVGTRASLKGLDAGDVQNAQAQIMLANTYHLYLKPGTTILESQGGIHNFMRWSKPVLTDSGGYQVFSLGAKLSKKTTETSPEPFVQITEKGVHFRSHWDNSKHFFTPEKAVEIQRKIGADIIMAFDECTPDSADPAYALQALERTHRWAHQCKEYWEENKRLSSYGKYQALFGIAQGGKHKELRQKSVQEIVNTGFDGIGFGGETVGGDMAGTVELMDWVRDIVPENLPRYAMGLGRIPQDLLDAVQAGYDMFDCIAPTRMARQGLLFTGQLDWQDQRFTFNSAFPKGVMRLGKEDFAQDDRVIAENCDCYTCQAGYSRSYLRHLYKVGEISYFRLSSIHNVRFMVRLSEQLRAEIIRG